MINIIKLQTFIKCLLGLIIPQNNHMVADTNNSSLPPPSPHTHFGFDLQALFFPVYNSSSLKPTQVETPKALTMDIKETFVCLQTSTLYHSEFVIWKMRIGTSTSHSNTEDWKSNKKYILCKWHTASIQWTSLLSPTPSPLYSYYIMRETICNY